MRPLKNLRNAIQRKSGVCGRPKNARAQQTALPACALAHLDLGVFSCAGTAHVQSVCAWIRLGQLLSGSPPCSSEQESPRLYGQLPGVEPAPYILRFDEDKPNLLYRKVCYTFAWNAVINFALLNLVGLVIASITGVWYMSQLYHYAYFPLCGLILLLGALGSLAARRPVHQRGRDRAPLLLRFGLGRDHRADIAACALEEPSTHAYR